MDKTEKLGSETLKDELGSRLRKNILKGNMSFYELISLQLKVGPRVWDILKVIMLEPSSSIYKIQKKTGDKITYPHLLNHYINRLEEIGLVTSLTLKDNKRGTRLIAPARVAWEYAIWVASKRILDNSESIGRGESRDAIFGNLCSLQEVRDILKKNDRVISRVVEIANASLGSGHKRESNNIDKILD